MGASVAVWHRRHGTVSIMEAPSTRCASVLQPVYSWLCDSEVQPSVNISDALSNDREMLDGAHALVKNIKDRTGVILLPQKILSHHQVNALQLATIYRVLDNDSEPRAQRVKDFMSQGEPAQRLGFYGTLKTGWDLYEDARLRPHLVTNLVLFGVNGGVTVVTDNIVSASIAQEWQTRVRTDPSTAIPLHLESLQNPRLHDLVGRGISHLVAMKT